jgi:uracil-DNA glycosylase family 4
MISLERKHPLAECEDCPLLENRFCPTSGPEDAKVAFVSRSPGKHDVIAKRPFAGPSGRVLDNLLRRHGVNRGDVLTTNVVLCQSDDPPLAAIKACKPRLEAEVANCDLIIAGGAEATRTLTKYKAVTSGRGFTITRPNTGRGTPQRVIVTNNPAAVYRDSDKFPDMIEDFRRAFNPPPPPVFPTVEVIHEPDKAANILRRWLDIDFGTLASDLEWAGNRIECAGFSRDGKKAVVFARSAIEQRDSRQLLKHFYEDGNARFVWHNGKSDTKILVTNAIAGRVDEDTFLQSYALDERPGYHSLEYLLSSIFGWPDYEPQSVKNFKKNGVFDEPVRRSQQELYKYNGWDTAGTKQLHDYFAPRLETDSVVELYRNRLLPAANAFRSVELRGFAYDVDAACNLREEVVIPRLYQLTETMQEISEHPLLNPGSWQQVKAILYDEWGLKHGLRDSGKKKFATSVGKEVRKEIEDDRFTAKPQFKGKVKDFAHVYEIFQRIDKQRGTYIEGLVKRTLVDGRIYCHFNVAGTATGRASSSDPNLQNITREGREGIPGIRTLFRPSDGCSILQADYSQAELRTCAKLSRDDHFLSIYRDSSRSLHKERAAAFYGDGYTKEEYVKSKNINFGVTYGQSAKAFAQMYHMPVDEAQAYIDSWWTEFPDLLVWVNKQKRIAHDPGYVVSPFGHKRRFHLITEDNVGDVEREAVNFLPQNIAAWLTILSIVELVEEYDMPVIATVHDSLVADVPENDVMEAAQIIKRVMEEQPIKQLGWQPDDIPFLVDLSAGETWGTLEELEMETVAA